MGLVRALTIICLLFITGRYCTLHKCDKHGLIPDPDKNKPLNTLTTGDQIECWNFCKYINSCKLFSFEHQNLVCNLYGGSYHVKEVLNRTVVGNWTSVYKSCYRRHVEPRGCVGEADLARGNMSVYLVKSESARTCLAVQKEVQNQTQNQTLHNDYNIELMPCEPDQLWKVNAVKNGFQLINKRWGMCLSWYRVGEIGVLGKAEDGVYGKMDLCSKENTHFAAFPPGIKCNSNILVVTGFFGEKLKFSFGSELAVDILPGPALDINRLCRNVTVTNGIVLNPQSLYLPGQIIKLQCNAGFGFKLLDYVSVQQIRCSNDLPKLICKKRPGCKIERDNTFLLSVLNLGFIIVSLVIANIVQCCVYRRRITQ